MIIAIGIQIKVIEASPALLKIFFSLFMFMKLLASKQRIHMFALKRFSSSNCVISSNILVFCNMSFLKIKQFISLILFFYKEFAVFNISLSILIVLISFLEGGTNIRLFIVVKSIGYCYSLYFYILKSNFYIYNNKGLDRLTIILTSIILDLLIFFLILSAIIYQSGFNI